jgi:hypothetical protein
MTTERISLTYLKWDGINYSEVMEMFSNVNREFVSYEADGTLTIDDIAFRKGDKIGVTEDGDLVKIF